MNELIAALLALSVQVTGAMEPVKLPEVRQVAHAEIAERACGTNVKRCADLHFFSDPVTKVIFVNKDVDYSLTLAQAELLYEVTRYTLSVNGLYHHQNSCMTNTRIEMALEQVRFDYIKEAVTTGKYRGFGLPEPHELPTHVFYCDPSKKEKVVEPKEELFV